MKTTTITSLTDLAFGCLKARVANRLGAEYRRQLPEALIRRAVDEAEAAARTTDYPQLFFPELAEEKLRAVHRAIATDFLPRAA
jgi:hypothetical protein